MNSRICYYLSTNAKVTYAYYIFDNGAIITILNCRALLAIISNLLYYGFSK